MVPNNSCCLQREGAKDIQWQQRKAVCPPNYGPGSPVFLNWPVAENANGCNLPIATWQLLLRGHGTTFTQRERQAYYGYHSNRHTAAHANCLCPIGARVVPKSHRQQDRRDGAQGSGEEPSILNGSSIASYQECTVRQRESLASATHCCQNQFLFLFQKS